MPVSSITSFRTVTCNRTLLNSTKLYPNRNIPAIKVCAILQKTWLGLWGDCSFTYTWLQGTFTLLCWPIGSVTALFPWWRGNYQIWQCETQPGFKGLRLCCTSVISWLNPCRERKTKPDIENRRNAATNFFWLLRNHINLTWKCGNRLWAPSRVTFQYRKMILSVYEKWNLKIG